MKIPNYLNIKISDAYLRQAQAKQSRNGKNVRAKSESLKAGKDEIVLSPRANEIRELEGSAKSIPEIRQEKAEAIKGQIESRTYNVNGKLVAQSIADLLS